MLAARLWRCLALATTLIMSSLVKPANAAQSGQSDVHSETLLRSISSWDGQPYNSYLIGRPEISVLKITIPPRTTLQWHSHPMPNAAYIVAGELTLERKKDGKKRHFKAGQALPETMGTLHRGISGNEPVVLIVFYAGIRGVPLTQR